MALQGQKSAACASRPRKKEHKMRYAKNLEQWRWVQSSRQGWVQAKEANCCFSVEGFLLSLVQFCGTFNLQTKGGDNDVF